MWTTAILGNDFNTEYTHQSSKHYGIVEENWHLLIRAQIINSAIYTKAWEFTPHMLGKGPTGNLCKRST